MRAAFRRTRVRIKAEAARQAAAGGSIAGFVDEPDRFWIIMRDVEGNEFCVIWRQTAAPPGAV